MSYLSSPVGQKNLWKTCSTFSFGGGGASGMSQPAVLCFCGFRIFFLTSSVPLTLFRLPLGGKGGGGFRDVPTSRTLHSRLPLLFLGFLSPISPVSTAKYLIQSIWNQKCHFRKGTAEGTNSGNQTLTRKSKMKPKIRDFFNQRKQDKNRNKYQMLAFPCVEQYCNRIK